MATWLTCGQNGYTTPGVMGVPKAERGDKKQKWLRSPHVTKVAKSPLTSWGSATRSLGTKNSNGYLAYIWAKWLHQPCRLGGPQHSVRGQK